MRLFLSSQDLGNYADVAFEMCGGSKRAAFILNAADDETPAVRADKLARKRFMFENAGFAFEELDLRKYFGRGAELKEKLKEFDLVWCNGGNSFILSRAMCSSGLDTILAELLSENKIMYGGSSAGSCVCAPSLHGAEYGDKPEPDVVPVDYPVKETIWDGLNLVPFSIIPHCDQEWFENSAKESIAYYESHNIPYKALNDGEVVMVSGYKTEFLT